MLINKLSGVRVGEYEIVKCDADRDDDFEYEEITVEELLNKSGLTKSEKSEFCKKHSAVNIHQLLAEETYDSCFQLLEDVKKDPRLAGLNAIVFLMLKPKGDRNKFNTIRDMDKFNALIYAAQQKEIVVGMDSCTAPMMLKFAETFGQYDIVQTIEPCESTLFSIYINVDAEVFPCSFTEGTPGWEHGVSMLEVENFFKDVWFNERISEWRRELTASSVGCSGCAMKNHCRSCPVFDITGCKQEK